MATTPAVAEEQPFVQLTARDFKGKVDPDWCAGCGSGISVMLTLAEYFAQRPAAERRRDLVFIGAAGRHVGSPGSRWLHENREAALANAVLMINRSSTASSLRDLKLDVVRQAVSR